MDTWVFHLHRWRGYIKMLMWIYLFNLSLIHKNRSVVYLFYFSWEYHGFCLRPVKRNQPSLWPFVNFFVDRRSADEFQPLCMGSYLLQKVDYLGLLRQQCRWCTSRKAEDLRQSCIDWWPLVRQLAYTLFTVR